MRVPDSDLGEAVVQNVVPKFSETPGSVDWLGVKMGTHNDEIFAGELQFPHDKIQRLKDAKII